MKRIYKIICIIIGLALLFFVLLFFISGKKGIGQIIDKIGFTQDLYEINISKDLIMDVYIYWYGETTNGPKDNKMLIYYRSQQSKIPPSYGINTLEIRYKDICYDKISIWKTHAYVKYNYNIKISKIQKNKLLITWHISNWYDPEIYQGRDTIRLGK